MMVTMMMMMVFDEEDDAEDEEHEDEDAGADHDHEDDDDDDDDDDDWRGAADDDGRDWRHSCFRGACARSGSGWSPYPGRGGARPQRSMAANRSFTFFACSCVRPSSDTSSSVVSSWRNAPSTAFSVNL